MPFLLIAPLAILLPLGSIAYVLWKPRVVMRDEAVETDAVTDVVSEIEESGAATRERDLLILAVLHDARKLTDAEYANEKTRVIHVGPEVQQASAASAGARR